MNSSNGFANGVDRPITKRQNKNELQHFPRLLEDRGQLCEGNKNVRRVKDRRRRVVTAAAAAAPLDYALAPLCVNIQVSTIRDRAELKFIRSLPDNLFIFNFVIFH